MAVLHPAANPGHQRHSFLKRAKFEHSRYFPRYLAPRPSGAPAPHTVPLLLAMPHCLLAAVMAAHHEEKKGRFLKGLITIQWLPWCARWPETPGFALWLLTGLMRFSVVDGLRAQCLQRAKTPFSKGCHFAVAYPVLLWTIVARSSLTLRHRAASGSPAPGILLHASLFL